MKVSIMVRNAAIVIVLIAGAWVFTNFAHISSFPGIISAFYAKEFCSCHFVEKRDEPFCHAFARQYVPIQDFVIVDNTVIVRGLSVTNSATYHSEREGCRID